MSLVAAEKSLAAPSLNLPSTADFGNVKLNNCDNAHIGTKVNINGGGGVILNQIVNVGDSKLDLRKLKEELNLATDSAIPEGWKQILLKFKYLWMSVILAMVVLVVAGCLFLFPSKKMVNDPDYSLNYTSVLISRERWSKTSEGLNDCDDLMIRPAKFVVIAHTVSSVCDKPVKCETSILNIQSDHRRRGWCYIGYNFIIGNDGYIYEGRGWGIWGSHTVYFNCDSIGVGLIGNFNNDEPTELMFQMLKILIKEGLMLNEISPDYKLIFQSQVQNKASPGTNVEKVLRKWDHWSGLNKTDYLCPK